MTTLAIAFGMGLMIGMCIGMVADMLYTISIQRQSNPHISDWVVRKPPLRRPF